MSSTVRGPLKTEAQDMMVYSRGGGELGGFSSAAPFKGCVKETGGRQEVCGGGGGWGGGEGAGGVRVAGAEQQQVSLQGEDRVQWFGPVSTLSSGPASDSSTFSAVVHSEVVDSTVVFSLSLHTERRHTTSFCIGGFCLFSLAVLPHAD